METTTLLLELTADEGRVLQVILCDYLSDLRLEMDDAESLDFREQLKNRETFIHDLLQRLGDEAR